MSQMPWEYQHPKKHQQIVDYVQFFWRNFKIVHEEILNLPLSQQPKARIVKPILIHLGIYTSSMITSA